MKIIGQKIKSSAGFTLLETLLYSVIFAVILSFTVVSFYQILGSHGQNQAKLIVQNEANFFMQKIIWAFSGAKTINQFSVSSSTLSFSIDKYNPSDNPIVFTFSGGGLNFSRGGGAPIRLSNNNVQITNIAGSYNPASGATPASLSLSFSVQSSSTDPNRQPISLQSKFYLRK